MNPPGASAAGRWLLLFWLHVLPWPALAGMALLWREATGSFAFPALVILVPLVYGYSVPAVGIVLLRKWRFCGPLSAGGMYWGHGGMFALHQNAAFCAAFHLLGGMGMPHSWTSLLLIALATGLGYAALGGFQDFACLQYGLLEFPRGSRADWARHVWGCALGCFTLLGAILGAAGTWAYGAWPAARIPGFTSWARAYGLTLGAMVVVSSLVYPWIERAFPASPVPRAREV